MKEIKYIFKVTDSHLHTGSHRCSDGWKYNFIDSTTVEGPFFFYSPKYIISGSCTFKEEG